MQVYIDVYMGYTQCTGVYRCIYGLYAVRIRDVLPDQKRIRKIARDFVSVYIFFGAYSHV